MNTLQIIEKITELNGQNFVEWPRSFNNVTQKAWVFLSKLSVGLEKPGPVFERGGGRDEMKNPTSSIVSPPSAYW